MTFNSIDRLVPRSLIVAAFTLGLAPWQATAQTPAPSEAPQVKMPTGGKALCLECHTDYSDKIEGKTVHGPVAADTCTACHNPHTSSHGKLLTDDPSRLCQRCHEDVRAEARRPVPHAALRDERACLACHVPHASDHGALLQAEQADTCVACHESVGAAMKLAHPHAPVAGGDCTTCHQPHGAEQASLLPKKAGALCRDCHDVKGLGAKHRNFALGDANCLSCHNPHGTAAAGLVRATVHPPFEQGSCDTCHEAPATPAKTVTTQPDLCLACHGDKDEQEPLGRNHLISGKATCTGCHSPHAGEGEGMIRGAERAVCLSCHTEIRQKVSTSLSYHPLQVEGGRCTACHQPHAAQDDHLLRRPETNLCVTCHETHAKFAHPMGPNVADPSRPGRSVTCLSCHNPHASNQKAMLLASPDRDLCIGCHKELH